MDNIATEAALTARNKIISISAVTAMPAIQIQYIGALDYGNYKVVSDTLTLSADGTDGDTTVVKAIDTNNSSFNDFGEVVDAINATGVFRAFLVGPRRNDLSTTMLDAIASATCKTKHGVTLFFEQATSAQVYGFAITNQKFLYRPTGGWATFDKGWIKDINAINSIKNLDLTMTTAAGDGTWFIYANDDENKQDGVLIHSEAFTTTTQETHGLTVPNEIHWEAYRGARISVQFLCTTAGSDWTGVAIIATGHTKDVCGGQVPDANYTGCV